VPQSFAKTITSLAASSSNVPWIDPSFCSSENFIDGNSSIDRIYSSNTELIHCIISRSHFNVIRDDNHSQIIQEQSPICNKLIGFWILINSMSLQDPHTSVKNELNVNRRARRAKYIGSQETALQPWISHWLKNDDNMPSITYVFSLEIRILKIFKGKAIPVQAFTVIFLSCKVNARA